MLRKSGVPLSELATMTLRFNRPGDLLLVTSIVEDPLYLTESLVWTARSHEE